MRRILTVTVFIVAVVAGVMLGGSDNLPYTRASFASDFLSHYASVRQNIAAQPEMNAPPAPAGRVRAPILVYHSVCPSFAGQTPIQREFDVEPAVFDRELSYLKDHGYTVIALDALIDHLTRGTLLASNPVALTFETDTDEAPPRLFEAWAQFTRAAIT